VAVYIGTGGGAYFRVPRMDRYLRYRMLSFLWIRNHWCKALEER